MNPEKQNQPTCRSARPPSTQTILTGLIAASAGLALASTGVAQGTTTNPFATFLHTVDGTFSGGVSATGVVSGEWSDVTPSAFISSPGSTAVPTTLGDPLANTLLYAGLGQKISGGEISLFLMYDFLPRTTAPLPGELFASITFPVTLPGRPTGDKQNISVLFIAAGSLPFAEPPGTSSFFDVFVDLDVDGTPDLPASQLGIIGATTPGSSPLSQTPHLRAELEVPLRIPAGFANPPAPTGPLPGNGINPLTGLYDPAPAFWGAQAAGDGGTPGGPAAPPVGPLQSASTANFTINPSGSISVQPVPEPSSAALALAGLAFLGTRRRKAQSAA